MNYLFELNHIRLLNLCLLLPVAFRLRGPLDQNPLRHAGPRRQVQHLRALRGRGVGPEADHQPQQHASAPIHTARSGLRPNAAKRFSRP